MRTQVIAAQGVLSAILAWISAKLGILAPVLLALMIMMAVDYVTGMLAAKTEAILYPDDPTKGWSSKKGAIGIMKKVGYMCVIAVAVVMDNIIIGAAAKIGYEIPLKAIFGFLVAIWYLLNELLSIIENAGRMGAPVPEWLTKYIAVLKKRIDDTGENDTSPKDG